MSGSEQGTNGNAHLGGDSDPHDGSPLLVEDHGDRVVIRLNRPEVRNAIDLTMVDALHEVCRNLEADPRVAILTGTGGTFAAGADIAQLRERRREDALAGINSKIFNRIQELPMPVIALVEGYALGGGAELAFACDFRIGTPSTKIGNPEAGLGILAAAGAAWRLRELVGEPRAKEILLAGRTLNAEEARTIGLLNDVVDPEDLEAAGQALAKRIASFAPLAVRLTKSAFHAPREAHPLIDNVAQAVLFETEEKFERMGRFLAKREAKRATRATDPSAESAAEPATDPSAESAADTPMKEQ
ncbi:enoyl-CoA hydratase/isomerase family protein [Brevibacterium sp.]|uniref:enoyl-CoA hydratase/isomerase family protein n=1 Tax=Brevibacterium sp. TaxID=1701 RepID=UPI002811ADA1|nr:enoyl-CoA hydratase/isomerase family protein [Brevibacterium sp.]